MLTETTDLKDSLERLINRHPEVVHENANKDANVFNTLRDLTAGTVAKSLGLDKLPKHVKHAHLNGDIHFHDLDYHPYMPMTNCCLIDIPNMLAHGFKIGNAMRKLNHQNRFKLLQLRSHKLSLMSPAVSMVDAQ